MLSLYFVRLTKDKIMNWNLEEKILIGLIDIKIIIYIIIKNISYKKI